mmetsp:Transcript_18920/g.31312  ORF Transcript_18920/g.31312 Transcript_18920/m.31312 type:complete len:94 (+) Transcript_18920:369-650(+)
MDWNKYGTAESGKNEEWECVSFAVGANEPTISFSTGSGGLQGAPYGRCFLKIIMDIWHLLLHLLFDDTVRRNCLYYISSKAIASVIYKQRDEE